MGEYIVPALAAVVVAVIEAVAARDRRRAKKDSAHAEERDKARENMMVLLVESSRASLNLGIATAHALQRGACNGDTEEALQYAADTKQRQKHFFEQQGIHAIWE